uniref:Transposase Tc1-like domain-containing protein n=1 Tax=Amphiprion ocellaris TaxID=80972 RepID=A0AAQ5WXS1_AMPOC
MTALHTLGLFTGSFMRQSTNCHFTGVPCEGRHVSPSTVQRRLREPGLYGQIAAKKPLLWKSNKQKRYVLAKKHQGMDIRPVEICALFWTMTPKHTSRLFKGYLSMKESDGMLHQMTWPPQSSNLNPIQMVWDEKDHRVKAKGATSAQHLWDLPLRLLENHFR